MTTRTPAQVLAHQRYDKKREVKKVSFNPDTEKHLIDAANSVGEFSVWVKKKLAQEIQEQSK